MKWKYVYRYILLVMMWPLLFAGCGSAMQEEGEEQGMTAEPGVETVEMISTAQELAAFFEAGGAEAMLTGDIALGNNMLKLENGRGDVSVRGEGHTLSGDGACVIRLADGASIGLDGITIVGAQTGIGALGDATLALRACEIRSKGNGIQAAGMLRLEADSALVIAAEEGAGVVCKGLLLEERCMLLATGKLSGIDAAHGDISLLQGAQAELDSPGDNVLRTDGALVLGAQSRLSVHNNGEHNAARVGTLLAEQSATLELTGGENGVGLFIVELYEDITIQGFCKKEVRVEAGKGSVSFSQQE